MMLCVNGRLVPAEAAALSPADRGFTLGDGLFETIRVRGGRPLRLADHLARLRAGGALLRLEVPGDEAGVAEAIAGLLAANRLRDAAVRLTVSRGPGARGLLPPEPTRPTVVLAATPLPPPPGPARVVVAGEVRRNPHSPLARCKALSYLDNVVARIAAEERGGDDALLLNTDGRVAETTIANLFVVTADGRPATPPVAEGALPGVRRGALLRRLGAVERPLTLGDVLAAREAFLTNALSIRPLVAVDGRAVGDGQPGALTRRLLDELDQE